MDNVLFNNNVIEPVIAARRPRTYRYRPSYTDEEIRDRYRFRRDSIAFICDVVDNDLRRPTRRNFLYSLSDLASLRFLANGCFFQVDANVLGGITDY